MKDHETPISAQPRLRDVGTVSGLRGLVTLRAKLRQALKLSPNEKSKGIKSFVYEEIE